MEAGAAVLASVGVGGELANVATPAIRTLHRFIGHGSLHPHSGGRLPSSQFGSVQTSTRSFLRSLRVACPAYYAASRRCALTMQFVMPCPLFQLSLIHVFGMALPLHVAIAQWLSTSDAVCSSNVAAPANTRLVGNGAHRWVDSTKSRLAMLTRV